LLSESPWWQKFAHEIGEASNSNQSGCTLGKLPNKV
jgi:hypothetical protein